MSRILDIQAVPEASGFHPRAPVGVLITLRNHGDGSLEFDFPYPAPSELSVISRDARLLALENALVLNREAIPRRLGPMQELPTRHELRRYFRFPGEGSFDVELHVDMTVQPIDEVGGASGSAEVVRWRHTVMIVIVPGVGYNIERFAQDLRGDDEQRRAEAVEVFSYLGNETALPYLREALEFRELRAEALRGLARIGSPTSLALIEDALGSSDLPTLQVGFSSLSAAGRPIQVETLRALVSSDDPAVQHACLEHLLSVGTREHAPVVSALGDSPNSAVAELATSFLARFK
ncbi:MAG: HEAT repeat domain-containing protein [Pseudomonadota bacterium]|nr:HEAT repeat domain-containing protein [Pseudomonadota bacterium]